jgi:hypothetical protein
MAENPDPPRISIRLIQATVDHANVSKGHLVWFMDGRPLPPGWDYAPLELEQICREQLVQEGFRG